MDRWLGIFIKIFLRTWKCYFINNLTLKSLPTSLVWSWRWLKTNLWVNLLISRYRVSISLGIVRWRHQTFSRTSLARGSLLNPYCCMTRLMMPLLIITVVNYMILILPAKFQIVQNLSVVLGETSVMQFLIENAVSEGRIFYFVIIDIKGHLLVVVALQLLSIGCIFLELIIRWSSWQLFIIPNLTTWSQTKFSMWVFCVRYIGQVCLIYGVLILERLIMSSFRHSSIVASIYI